MNEQQGAEVGTPGLSALQWLGEQVPGGFFIYRADARGELIYANRATLRIYGCDGMEAFLAHVGGCFRGMVHPEDYERVQSSIDAQIAEGSAENLDYVEYRIRRADGAVRWVDDYGHFAELDGYGGVYYVFLSDITERKEARERQFRAEMDLERERRANEVKSDFLFNVSHDIRTPMNAIMGFAALARRHMDEPERLRDCLDKVEGSTRQLLALIDDLLEMNKLRSGHVELKAEPCDLREQLSMAADLFRPEMEEKRLTLIEQIDLPEERVTADANRLRRVLGNLLSNAVRFTPPGGTVTLSARRTQRSDSGYGRYVFSVADTGVGMSEDFMRRMYDAFEREESSTRSGTTGSGTGLGLSITKHLLDVMGGSISVRSKKGEGSVFTVELPLRRAEHAPVPPPGETRDRGRHRILLVEDVEINRMLAETILQEAGFLVESVPDGCDAVDAVAQRPPRYYDLVLMDIQMPVMNGYEATRAIRALGRADTAALPIIALSANAREEDKRASLDSGMNSHIAKPFDVERLIAAVNEHISRNESEP